ncbi:MAG: dihydrofolate reductase family protein [Nitrososphaerota archaeon]
MRKVQLSMHVSLDGYVAGPDGELDWMIRPGHSGQPEENRDAVPRDGEYVQLGRVSCSHSTSNGSNSQGRVGFSPAMGTLDWRGAHLADAVAVEIGRLKQQRGKDIIVTGGPALARSLSHQDLIDEYNLVIHPVALGNGIPLFQDLADWRALKLVGVQALATGAILATYHPASRHFQTRAGVKE